VREAWDQAADDGGDHGGGRRRVPGERPAATPGQWICRSGQLRATGADVRPCLATVQQGPRPVELKRDLVRRLTDAMVESLQIPPEAVQVWIHETPTDSWGVAGVLTADK